MENNNIINNSGNIAGGNQVINNYTLYTLDFEIDIGLLINICQTNSEKIKNLLLDLKNDEKSLEPDDRSIKLECKNRLNELTEFYNEFIKTDESKLDVLDGFFKENNLTEYIEEAADTIKRSVFSFNNINSAKLCSEIFNKIITKHTQKIDDIEDKKIMKLIIFYLYRYCYIGLKDEN
ncbi:hypothetical protein CHL_0362 [Campylobacter hyointestinalis subsp. lawsonii CCUG 27631]|uniref:hypothetical protein n=1 Tax=Campylobacter hyointestinalis TaxID=198 RepID=UPI0007C8DC55|nr:hypothetical protein [Campylobacter hyointestinalis]ANE33738.1 hypothetical protein CHL_0362 [Campylobacter hyointestinalis subsp. lawsonii CCUG 27631]